MWAKNNAVMCGSVSSISSSLSRSSSSGGGGAGASSRSDMVDQDSVAIEDLVKLDDLIDADDKHAEYLKLWFEVLRNNKQLCDLVLIVGGKEIRAHRVVVSAMGGVMADLLLSNRYHKRCNNGTDSSGSNNGNNNNNNKRSSCSSCHSAFGVTNFHVYSNGHLFFIELPTVDAECMEVLVNCAYDGRLSVSKDKVSAVYDLACMLRCDSVAKVCATYLCANLSIENCINTRKCANRYNDQLLTSVVDQYIKNNFDVIASKSREFSALPHIQVKVISDRHQLINWELFVQQDMGEKLLEWFQHRVRALPQHMEFRIDIFADKPLACYFDETWTLHDCSDADDSSSFGSCDLVQEFKRSTQKLYPNNGAAESSTDRNNGVAKCHGVPALLVGDHSPVTFDCEEVEWKVVAIFKTTEVAFTGVFVVKRKMAVVTIEVISHENARPRSPAMDNKEASPYNTQPGGCSRLPKMIIPRCAGGVVTSGSRIVAIGGYNRFECLKHVEFYSADRNRWAPLPAMLVPRSLFNAAICDGKIYAVGGSDGCNDLSTVEEWNPVSEGPWKFAASLPSPRCGMGVVASGNGVYCIGGLRSGRVLTECLRYDVRSRQWSPIASLVTGRSEMGCVAWENKIYVIGGCDEWSKLSSVECYDMDADRWREVGRLKMARRGCSAAVVDGVIYVAGGTDGIQSLDSVECFQPGAGDWQMAPCMRNRRAHVRLVALDKVLYALGGFDGAMFLNSVEYLAQGSMEWKKFF